MSYYHETWYMLKKTEYSRVPGTLIFKFLVRIPSVNNQEVRTDGHS